MVAKCMDSFIRGIFSVDPLQSKPLMFKGQLALGNPHMWRAGLHYRWLLTWKEGHLAPLTPALFKGQL